jgi:hypothetical protein
MIYIKLSESLTYSSPEKKRKVITSDETWAFTEQPKTEMTEKDKSRICAHDLFNMFTADIIRENVIFTR